MNQYEKVIEGKRHIVQWYLHDQLQEFYFLRCFYRILIRWRAKRKIREMKRISSKSVFTELKYIPTDVEDAMISYI